MTAPPPLPRAGFVTVMAKLSLVVAGLGVAWSLLQALGALLLPDGAVARLAAQPEVPAGVIWALEHRLGLSLLGLALALLFLAASWGLLKRQEWARWTFIAFLVGTAALNFAGLAAIGHVFDTMLAMFPADMLDTPDGREFMAQMQASRMLSYGSGLLGALAFAGLHGWIVWKLCTAPARDEFRRPGA